MTILGKETLVKHGGHTLTVISKTNVNSHVQKGCVYLFGDKSPVAVVQSGKGDDDRLTLLDDTIERADILEFLANN